MAAGCDWVDVKEPANGPLGRATPAVWQAIAAELAAATASPKLTIALGEQAPSNGAAMLPPGVSLVKLGPTELPDASDGRSYRDALVAERRTFGIGPFGWASVGYADHRSMQTMASRRTMLAVARDLGDEVFLVDTFDKRGPRLCQRWTDDDIARLVEEVHEHGLKAAVAGRLTHDDLRRLAPLGVDVLGVRSAACGGDRRDAIREDAVRDCVEAVRPATA